MKDLKRTKVDSFEINSAIEVNELDINLIKEKIVSIEDIFKNNKKIDLNNKQLQLFLNGVKISKTLDDNIYRIYNNNNFIGLGIVKNNLLKRDVII